MKNLVICLLVLPFLSCSETKSLTPSETATIVLESLYAKDNNKLKSHTTTDGYSSLVMIQDLIPDENNAIKISIIDEALDEEIAWIKYSSNYDSKPGVFKLVKEDNQWKVTSKGPRERGPF